MNEELKTQLKGYGLTDEQVTGIEGLGVTLVEDMQFVTDSDLTGLGIKPIAARKIIAVYKPKTEPAVTPAAAPTSAPDAEIPEGKAPSETQIKQTAQQWGMDPSMLGMVLMGNLASGSGMDFDMSTMMPIPAIVGGYSPKIRNINFLVMGQVERRLNTPIVVINTDGSVNPDQTVKYIMSLEEGFEPAEDNVYYDEEGTPYEVIKVGVDAQSVYDADPVNPSRALQKNSMGMGRINWNGVLLDVRQVVFYAATQTGELSPSDDSRLGWLRDHIKPSVTRVALRGEFPKALTMYNEAARTGALPTLRVQLSRGPRRPEIMPRRRARTEVRPSDEGEGFRSERSTEGE